MLHTQPTTSSQEHNTTQKRKETNQPFLQWAFGELKNITMLGRVTRRLKYEFGYRLRLSARKAAHCEGFQFTAVPSKGSRKPEVCSEQLGFVIKNCATNEEAATNANLLSWARHLIQHLQSVRDSRQRPTSYKKRMKKTTTRGRRVRSPTINAETQQLRRREHGDNTTTTMSPTAPPNKEIE